MLVMYGSPYRPSLASNSLILLQRHVKMFPCPLIALFTPYRPKYNKLNTRHAIFDEICMQNIQLNDIKLHIFKHLSSMFACQAINFPIAARACS